MKLYTDGLLYYNIPLKYVTNIDILNIMYSEIPKKTKILWQSHIESDKETNYIYNDMHAKMEPKFQ